MPDTKPNIVLLMCDDLGYGDTGFNGNTMIQTPYLDALRAEGAAFTRFYVGGPVCSPTRGTCLTGRHYARYGVVHANRGRLPAQEVTLMDICRARGYRTGHFGKWHLGTLTRSVRDSNRGGPDHLDHYAPPWVRGFDVCFSTEAKVPTWDPMVTPDERRADGTFRWGEPGTPFGTFYWNEAGERVRDGLAGDDSRAIVDRALPFMRDCARAGVPFLAVVWFHAPHTPVVAGPEYRAMYADFSEDEQHYYGCVTAMDEQVGRLNRCIKDLGLEQTTMLWFCSDNGPEGTGDPVLDARSRGSTGGLRGRKRSLFNGGVGVPALVTWPGHVTAGATYTMPCSTLDYLPTISDLLGYTMPDDRPIDGVSLLPMIDGGMATRPVPVPYRFLERREAMFGAPTLALTDNRYKLLTNLSGDGAEDLLFDVVDDPAETTNVIASTQGRERAAAMRAYLRDFIASCRRSHQGGDYPVPYEPVNAFQEITGTWLEV